MIVSVDRIDTLLEYRLAGTIKIQILHNEPGQTVSKRRQDEENCK